MSRYIRDDAVKYALSWWNKANPDFYNFDKIGGDCTNFVSQCIYYGGITMDYSSNGWYYKSLNSRAPAWTGVSEFYNYGVNNNKSDGVRLIECNIEDATIGDIVQIDLYGTGFHHTAIITEKLGNTFSNVFITCHTVSAKNKPLSRYKIKNIRFLKVY